MNYSYLQEIKMSNPGLNLILILVIVSSFMIISSHAHGVNLLGMYGDNMVLQRDQPIHIQGKAPSETRVRCSLANHTAEGVSGPDGYWSVILPSQPAGGPWDLVIEADQKQVFRNIWIGDVWFFAGQSNMVYPLRNEASVEQELPLADHPRIRLFSTQYASSPRPEGDVLGQWRVCQPESVADFSAVAYFMGRDLHLEEDVPIGLIVSAVGGTSITSWSSPAGLDSNPALRKTAEKYRQRLVDFPNALDDSRWHLPGVDQKQWQAITVPMEWEKAGVGLDQHNGVVWYRRSISIPEAWAGQSLELHMGPIDDFDEVWFDGHWVGTARGIKNAWKTHRRYTIPSNIVTAGRKDLTIRVTDRFGGGGLLGEPADYRLHPVGHDADAIPLSDQWLYRVASWKSANDMPTGLYHGMVSPWTAFPVRGVVWYQGESDAGHPKTYRHALHALVESWRTAWGSKDLPFLVVQLPDIGPIQKDPNEQEGWATIREAQRLAAKESGAHLINTLGVGGAPILHPDHKRAIGQRLAKTALANVYNKEVAWSGPVFHSATVTQDVVHVKFDHASGLRPADGEVVRGFALAGDNGHYHWAEVVLDHNSVRLRSDAVPEPRHLRYAWAGNPVGNLSNAAGLPAFPFQVKLYP